MEKIFVKQLEEKQAVQSVFWLQEKLVLRGKNGKSYLSLTLADRSGVIDARLWDNVEELSTHFQSGDFVRVKGVVQLFQNRKQLVVHKIEAALEGEFDLRDFMQISQVDPELMLQKLLELVATVKDDRIRELISRVLSDPEIRQRVLRAPAAKTIHHAYWGGLLEHILSICQIMDFLARHYPQLNRDLLLFGAIFHDLGKIWELDFTSGTRYTDAGRMVGHLVMAVELVEKFAARIADFPEELKIVLKHIILSHHGRLEYGSPKTPQFLEAFVVAFIDDFDSKVNTIENFIRSERESGENWSRFNSLFDRYFYLGVRHDQSFGATSRREAPASQLSSEPGGGGLSIPVGVAGLSYRTPGESAESPEDGSELG